MHAFIENGKFIAALHSSIAFCRAFKHYNNHSGAYIAGTRNSTSAYIVIMASLQALVNSLLVWQSSCENKLRVF